MRVKIERFAFVTVVGLLWLAGCETTSVKIPEVLGGKKADIADDVTGSVPIAKPRDIDVAPEPVGAPPQLLPDNMTPSQPNDDASVGRENFRQGNYGLAEKFCRRAVEAAPKDAAAWLCLAASYDRLKRFDLADRAYDQLAKLVGRGPVFLNNLGYSYILRGDFGRARTTLLAAKAQDPTNPFIENNLVLLDEAVRNGLVVR